MSESTWLQTLQWFRRYCLDRPQLKLLMLTVTLTLKSSDKFLNGWIFFAVPLSDWPLGLCIITHLSLTYSNKERKNTRKLSLKKNVFELLDLLGNTSENPTTVVFYKLEITHTYFSISNSLLLLVKEPQSATGFWCSEKSHRVTSGQSKYVISRFIYRLLKKVHKTNHYTNT